MERSAGCIAVKLLHGQPVYGMILDRYGRWCFPKGHLEAGETAFAAARRELAEEVGISDVELTTRLGDTRYAFVKEGVQTEKHVEWFLVRATGDAQLRRADPDHVLEADWLPYGEAVAKLGYADLMPLLRIAEEVVQDCYVTGKPELRKRPA